MAEHVQHIAAKAPTEHSTPPPGGFLDQLVADPCFSEEHIARLYRVFRVALPLYALVALFTALGRARTDPVIGALWALQAAFGVATQLALLLQPRRAHRVLQIGVMTLVIGLLVRIPRAVSVSGLQDVDLYGVTLGCVLGLLVIPIIFAPAVARHTSVVFAIGVSATALVSLFFIPNLSAWHVFPVLRLIASVATLVALIGFVCDTVYEYARLWEEHRLVQTLALSDSLTGLANRRAGEAALRRELSRSEREHEPLSVIMLDVDHFKRVNDLHGHDAGDRALLGIAHALRKSLRASDEPVRWAGDEFVVILPNTALGAAAELAERLRHAISDTFETTDQRGAAISVSLGVAERGPHDGGMAELLARADANLYAAKHRGRDCVVAA